MTPAEARLKMIDMYNSFEGFPFYAEGYHPHHHHEDSTHKCTEELFQEDELEECICDIDEILPFSGEDRFHVERMLKILGEYTFFRLIYVIMFVLACLDIIKRNLGWIVIVICLLLYFNQ